MGKRTSSGEDFWSSLPGWFSSHFCKRDSNGKPASCSHTLKWGSLSLSSIFEEIVVNPTPFDSWSYLSPTAGSPDLEKWWATHSAKIYLIGLCVAWMPFSPCREPSHLTQLHFKFRCLNTFALKMAKCLKHPRAPTHKRALVQRH